jgi:hypothetical protein
MNFFETPIGSKLGWAIHEQNSGIGTIRSAARNIKTMFKNGTLTEADLTQLLFSIETGIKRQEAGMDSAYVKIKEIINTNG